MLGSRFMLLVLRGTLKTTTTLKRLLFESHTMLLAQLREQVSNPQASASSSLPAVEREAKLRDLGTV